MSRSKGSSPTRHLLMHLAGRDGQIMSKTQALSGGAGFALDRPLSPGELCMEPPAGNPPGLPGRWPFNLNGDSNPPTSQWFEALQKT
ncbi:MAG: hypothetical protein SFV17_26500 [Candidatus Obscuribacter sp.]|nr:hypothetical protein [Candidatus Obscuribacter sp.]